MSLPEVIRCGTCRVKIRVPEGRDLSRARCPKCQAPLAAAELTEDGVDELIGDIRVSRIPFAAHEREPVMDSFAPAAAPAAKAPPRVEQRYRGMRRLAGTCRFLGWLCTVLFIALVALTVIMLVNGPVPPDPFFLEALAKALVGTLVGSILWRVFGGAIDVLLDIEENTRRALYA